MTFKKSGRYSIPSDEDFEPDSNDEVLKNCLHIKSKNEMEALERQELERTELVELILIHPFREGNGRVARLLADLMSMQAKKPPLNYALIDQTENQQGFQQYILAIHAGVSGNYEPIKDSV